MTTRGKVQNNEGTSPEVSMSIKLEDGQPSIHVEADGVPVDINALFNPRTLNGNPESKLVLLASTGNMILSQMLAAALSHATGHHIEDILTDDDYYPNKETPADCLILEFDEYEAALWHKDAVEVDIPGKIVEICKEFRKCYPDIPVIILDGQGLAGADQWKDHRYALAHLHWIDLQGWKPFGPKTIPYIQLLEVLSKILGPAPTAKT